MNKNSNELFTIKMTRALEDNVFASGVSIFEMMEIAGKVVSEEVSKYAKKNSIENIVFVSGFGNNGGDALVAAKYLIEEGFNCEIVLVGDKKKFNSQASQKNYENLIEILPEDRWFKIKNKKNVETVLKNVNEQTIIVDALFGIGIQGKLKEPYKTVVEFLNNIFEGDIISLDIPSGYNPEIDSEIYVENPNLIICLGRNKIKQNNFAESSIIVRNIGIPEESELFVGIGDLKWFFPKRKKSSHKRQNGVVTVIAGSKDYVGAPALAGFGAFRTGADLVFIITPTNIRETVASFAPDFITIPAHENEIEPIDIIKAFEHPRLNGSAFVIGPGMMNTAKTKDTLLEFLKNEVQRQVVIDASALSAMEEEHLSLLEHHRSILTPHGGEFFRIFEKKLTGELEKDIKIVEEAAKKWKTTILLKGEKDIISDSSRTKINKTGHPGMTVGGTGDVLTGIVASILSVTNDTFLSACLGAYISGAAGELASEHFGDGLMASDIPEYIHQIIGKAMNFKAKEI
ncbi:MAG: NAD(P)H-hydrate dehydratase [Candidatus Heimdallarchaeota archaeon]|nr:NAD(P)H-hydrate dehydratase [Candidatus Heimdallarchaeota archaeon]MCK4769465.1 NAD(P)H-hydrate dehydratase [Candidatus Heimdallarchaeota archaeon]